MQYFLVVQCQMEHPPWLDQFDDGLTLSPLNRRAWVPQERLLSRCVLPFGAKMLSWECNIRFASKVHKEGASRHDQGGGTPYEFETLREREEYECQEVKLVPHRGKFSSRRASG